MAEGAHAAALRYDPHCVVAMGDSAGAHLATMLPLMAAAHGGPCACLAAQVRVLRNPGGQTTVLTLTLILTTMCCVLASSALSRGS